MYGHQKLLRIKNIIDLYKNDTCSKCGLDMLIEKKDQLAVYSKNDIQPIKDYYKKINFLLVRMFVGHTEVCSINFLDNKEKILHSEYFREKEFYFDDNVYLLPFLKVLYIYSKNNLPSTLRKLLIESYNELLIKVVQSNSNSVNAVYGKHISNYGPSEKLVKMFQSEEPILVNNEIKEFVSDEFYQKYEGQQISIIVTEQAQENFLKKYTTSDKENYLVWMMLDDFTRWYIENNKNYKFLCNACFGKAEFKRARRLVPTLISAFDNKQIDELREKYRSKITSLKEKNKEQTKQMYKEFRPEAFKAQYGTTETVTETVIEKGKKTTKTSTKKS
tara:strand:+ start:83 stop:1078 length:996 start_codon:yes stop_codon:yes gene_type:complete